jgi:hypothetical protein
MRAVIYARYSSENQREASIADQVPANDRDCSRCDRPLRQQLTLIAVRGWITSRQGATSKDAEGDVPF